VKTGVNETRESNEVLKNYETIILVLGILVFIVLLFFVIKNS